MPHSSGGGFHGGGFHSGGGFHGTSSGSGSSGVRISSRPFAGSTKYYYYSRNRIRYVYSNGPVQNNNLKTAFVVTLLSFFFILVGIALPFLVRGNTKKINSNFKTGIVIEDNANILEDTEELNRAFEDFYDETGIVPSLITVEDSEWHSKYHGNLTKYAYDSYVKRFSDEYHWLIVYSVDKNCDVSFRWEGMQGNYTDPILTKAATDAFGKRLHNNFESGTYSVDESLVDAFDYFTPKALKGFIDMEILGLFCTMILIFGSIAVFFIVMISKQNKINKSKPWKPTYREAICEDCGRPYVKGSTKECPFCGAYVS